MSYTNDTKPTNTYTNDSKGSNSYTNDSKPTTSTVRAGQPIGLLLALTYAQAIGAVYTNDLKP